jgi:hypothetical protein
MDTKEKTQGVRQTLRTYELATFGAVSGVEVRIFPAKRTVRSRTIPPENSF